MCQVKKDIFDKNKLLAFHNELERIRKDEKMRKEDGTKVKEWASRLGIKTYRDIYNYEKLPPDGPRIPSDKNIETMVDNAGWSVDTLKKLLEAASVAKAERTRYNRQKKINESTEAKTNTEGIVAKKNETTQDTLPEKVDTIGQPDPEVRVLLDWTDLEDNRNSTSFAGRVLDFAYLAGVYSIENFASSFGLSLEWFNDVFYEQDQTQKWEKRIIKELTKGICRDAVGQWLRDGECGTPFDVILSEFRAGIRPPKESASLKTNGSSGS